MSKINPIAFSPYDTFKKQVTKIEGEILRSEKRKRLNKKNPELFILPEFLYRSKK